MRSTREQNKLCLASMVACCSLLFGAAAAHAGQDNLSRQMLEGEPAVLMEIQRDVFTKQLAARKPHLLLLLLLLTPGHCKACMPSCGMQIQLGPCGYLTVPCQHVACH